jgi:hypothetical protein
MENLVKSLIEAEKRVKHKKSNPKKDQLLLLVNKILKNLILNKENHKFGEPIEMTDDELSEINRNAQYIVMILELNNYIHYPDL